MNELDLMREGFLYGLLAGVLLTVVFYNARRDYRHMRRWLSVQRRRTFHNWRPR